MIETQEPTEGGFKLCAAFDLGEPQPRHTFYGVLFREGTYYDNRPFTPTRQYLNHLMTITWSGDSIGYKQLEAYCDSRITRSPTNESIVAVTDLTAKQEEKAWDTGFCSKCRDAFIRKLEERDRSDSE